MVVVGTARGHIFSLRRLRVLPDLGEADTALYWAWGMSGRIYRKCTAGRGRAGIIDRPIDDLAASRILADIFRGDDIVVIFRCDPGAIDSGTESGGDHTVDPGVDISLLLWQHASALFLVEEDDGVRGKPFAAGGSGGGMRIGVAELRCASDRFQFCIEASIEEDEESEACGFNGSAVASPGVRLLAGRMVEPVAGVGESLVQGFQIGVAGVGIAVEAEEGGALQLTLRKKERGRR